MGKRAMRVLLWTATAALAAWTIWQCAPRPAPVTAGPAVYAGRGCSAVLDINAADAGVLEELPGVGPVLAERIVQAREESGPFDGPEALMDVPGVGPALWEDIAPFVYFGE